MKQIRILLMPRDMRRDIHLINAEKAAVLKQYVNDFLMLPPMSVHSTDEGEDLADEMFDLTNNPSRQEERVERYGNGPSLSVGDVVRTPEGDFMCCSFGWAKM